MISGKSHNHISTEKSLLRTTSLNESSSSSLESRLTMNSLSSTTITSKNNIDLTKQITNPHKLYAITNESTHAYSYNPLSPNSLTVRLNILKRTLQVLIKNPDMLREPNSNTLSHHNHTPVSYTHLTLPTN